MSIALAKGGSLVGAAGIVRGVSCIPVFDGTDAGDDRSPAMRKLEGAPGAAVGQQKEASSCSSSIGRNSDSLSRSPGSDGEEGAGEAEVLSAPKGPLDTTDALEEALPVRRGISKYYSGKSKSFTSMAEMSSSSKDLAKPENAYTRKRKNLLALSIYWDQRHCSRLRGAAGAGEL